MSHQIVRQPDGGLAIWSSVVDDFVLVDAAQDDLVDFLLEGRVSFMTGRVAAIVASLERGRRPYGGHTRSWEDCQAERARQHGEPFDLEKARRGGYDGN